MHNNYNAIIWHKELYVGGGTHVYKLFVKCLEEMGFNVITITTGYPLKSKGNISKTIVINECSLKDDVIKLIDKLKPRIIIRISGSLLDYIIPSAVRKKTIIINYIHFPYDAIVKLMESILRLEDISPTAFLDDIIINLLRIVFFKRESEMSRPSEDALVLVNSNFTKHVIETIWGIKAYTLYPTLLEEEPKPLNYDIFARKDKNLVTMLGTYTIGKRYHFLPLIAKHLHNYGIITMGSTPSQFNILYYKILSSLNNALGIRNVLMLCNVKENVKKRVLSRSIALLHLRFFEHFGIAILEGIAYGNIPIVHVSGGQYEVCKNFFPFWCKSFTSTNPEDIGSEVSEILNEISSFSIDELYKNYNKAFSTLKHNFSFNTFKEKFSSIIKIFTR